MSQPKRLDATVPGGLYISGGQPRDGQHYGGRVVDAEGRTLAEYADDEVNPGTPRPERPEKPEAKPSK
jgi:hypothetical protein